MVERWAGGRDRMQTNTLNTHACFSSTHTHRHGISFTARRRRDGHGRQVGGLRFSVRLREGLGGVRGVGRVWGRVSRPEAIPKRRKTSQRPTRAKNIQRARPKRLPRPLANFLLYVLSRGRTPTPSPFSPALARGRQRFHSTHRLQQRVGQTKLLRPRLLRVLRRRRRHGGQRRDEVGRRRRGQQGGGQEERGGVRHWEWKGMRAGGYAKIERE